ncbi:MAG: GNAT family N-acetyltransferase [Saprospiraceae bacterium]
MFFEKCVLYNQLSLDELYEILRLRHLVFVIEQDCIFMDADRFDRMAHHLLLFDEKGILAGYSRLFDIGNPYPGFLSIGRVVTHPDYRNKKCGKQLMQSSIFRIRNLFGNHPIKIGAQAYLKDFYKSFGFKDIGQYYLEDSIPHLKMILP